MAKQLAADPEIEVDESAPVKKRSAKKVVDTTSFLDKLAERAAKATT